VTKDSNSAGKAARTFINDIEPFLYGRPITYIDVGAYVGEVFTELVESAVRVRTAHLIEPNPDSYQRLKTTTQDISSVTKLVCHNVALSDTTGILTMSDEGTMSHVVGEDDREKERIFETPAVTLDELARQNGIERIDLLKVDVEGHELGVIGGAKGLLSDGLVDVIYIEAAWIRIPRSRSTTGRSKMRSTPTATACSGCTSRPTSGRPTIRSCGG
jgi:FkbM family methyltransferase